MFWRRCRGSADKRGVRSFRVEESAPAHVSIYRRRWLMDLQMAMSKLEFVSETGERSVGARSCVFELPSRTTETVFSVQKLQILEAACRAKDIVW